SRFPLLPIQRNGVALAYVEVATGRVVAVANTQLPSDRSGSKAATDVALQRIAVLKPMATVLPALASDGVPTFLTGNFNAPSHLDQPEAATKSGAASTQKLEWLASKLLADRGLIDSYRAVHADPVAKPGATWTPGHPSTMP